MPPARRRLAVALAAALMLLLPAGAAAQEAGEAFLGALQFEREPVAGVRIEVRTAAGELIGDAVTAEDGSWTVELPGPGTYTATLDPATLPDGVALRDSARQTLEVQVTSGRQRRLLFALGEGVVAGPSLAERAAQATLNGVKLGLIVAICSIGLSLIFGTTGLINFAHGELVTFGALVAWYFNASTPDIHLLGAGVIAIALAGGLGASLEVGMLRPLRRRRLGAFQFVVLTIGLSLLLRHIMLLFFGPDPARFRDFALQAERDFGPFSITPRDLTIMVLSAVLLVAVALMLQRTRLGKAMRAVSDDVDLAESSGIDVNRVVLVVWVLGAALAGTGGIFLGSIEAVDWFMGFRLLLLMFAAVVLGGLGTAYGAMVGGLVIGIVTEVSTIWFQPEIKSVFALGALIVVLLLRPQGVLGARERIG